MDKPIQSQRVLSSSRYSEKEIRCDTLLIKIRVKAETIRSVVGSLVVVVIVVVVCEEIWSKEAPN